MTYPVSIKGVFSAPDGRVVLLLNERGEWELPGGPIGEGESAEGCLAREVEQELGVSIAVGAPLDSYLLEVMPGRTVFVVTYACLLVGRYLPAQGDGHQEVGLFAADGLPERLPAGYRASIAAWAAARPGHLAQDLLVHAYNNAWANHRLLRSCSALSQTEFEAPRSGAFPSIRATLNHILMVDRFYVDALEREARGAPPNPDNRSAFFAADEPFGDCAGLWDAQHASDRRLVAYCARLTDSSLQRVVSIQRPGEVQRDTRERLLAHIFQHQAHHRGQVHAMLSSTSVDPPQLDEFFAQGEAPLRAQDFAELGWSESMIWGRHGQA